MEKKDLVNLLNEIFIPLGFKRKGNNWVHNGSELSKVINLQKSNYSNSFYVNYGFILKCLELDGWRSHIGYRLGTNYQKLQPKYTDIIDLEIEGDTNIRLSQLKENITNQMVEKFLKINTEVDLFNILKDDPNLYGVPLEVKNHFNLKSK